MNDCCLFPGMYYEFAYYILLYHRSGGHRPRRVKVVEGGEAKQILRTFFVVVVVAVNEFFIRFEIKTVNEP